MNVLQEAIIKWNIAFKNMRKIISNVEFYTHPKYESRQLAEYFQRCKLQKSNLHIPSPKIRSKTKRKDNKILETEGPTEDK